jgi:hypothetical protein
MKAMNWQHGAFAGGRPIGPDQFRALIAAADSVDWDDDFDLGEPWRWPLHVLDDDPE